MFANQKFENTCDMFMIAQCGKTIAHCILHHVVALCRCSLFLKWKPPKDIPQNVNVRTQFGLKTPNPRTSNFARRY